MNWKPSTYRTWICVFGAAVALTSSSTAAQRAAQGDWCAEGNWGNDREGVCDVREYTLPASGTVTVDATPNGGINVQGEPRNDVLVYARVIATADTQDEARAIAAQVQVTAAAGRVEATGPRNLARHAGWHVSYRLRVPPQLPLSLKSTNGGIAIDNVTNRAALETTNGGLKLTHIAGDIEGRTTNGGIDVTLDGNSWQGNGLDLQTTNGGVRVSVPDNYNAHLETGTTNGRISIDFPVSVQGTLDRSISTDLGSGGPPIKVRTSNGGVKITRR
jgi:putative adhesin